VAAWRDEAPVALGPIRQRAVLALLALHAEAGLNRTAIIDALWGDDPPETAVTMVQGYIARIRRLLGPGDGPPARGGVLWWDGALYRLARGAVDSDLAEFTELAECAQRAAAEDPLQACQLYEQAVRLLVLREQIAATGAMPGPEPTQTAAGGGDPVPATADRPVPRQLPAPARHFAGRATSCTC
jgi:DNA-binding SARP family transcriptional activator